MPIYHKIKSGKFDAKPSSKIMRVIARNLRNNLTPTEHILWQRIRKKRLAGLKFRRQHIFGSSIVDFYCSEKRLAIEIDGGYHLKPDIIAQDKVRQEIIEMYGVQFLRFPADDVENNIESILSRIKATANKIKSR
ncbi:endonuclease domain-containing protein [Candidatus Neomarinimicrobiota bacterium]